jgi:hypothetical protein
MTRRDCDGLSGTRPMVPVDSETTKPCRAAFLQPVDLIENVVDRPMFLRSFRGYGPHISCAIVQNRVSSGGWCSAQEWRLRGSHSFSPSRGTNSETCGISYGARLSMTLRIAQIASVAESVPPAPMVGSPKNSYARTRSDLVRQRRLINLGYACAMLPDGIATSRCASCWTGCAGSQAR